ncbi:fibronectin type III domain-containing protein 9 [Cololabis saira]|uniref:fibronectin type III domain-containing protein 9 n=1 Tax=Cololabis saira TaxID=129043 RepID=UPI002AD4CEF5|nr:fibronectin type III domain-containing protein 9 [Cololabis saira]
MGVAVYNVSSTSARVSWPASPTCADTFYSVMYHPNWNDLLTGYKRKRFKHEERIPVSQTSMHLANLLSQTAYFLCVTCQAANPVQDQCQMFSTLSKSSEGHDGAGWGRAVAIWLTCSLLVLVCTGVLVWGCRRHTRSSPGRAAGDCPVLTNPTHQNMSECGHLFTPRRSSVDHVKHSTIIQPSLMPEQVSGQG